MESKESMERMQMAQETKLCDLPLAIASVPCQKWVNTYDYANALKEGTIFPELNKPFYCGGE
ncbi:hypothetical protein lbkm_2632 [Lachnospiraceae bacterium KM106-2]|nr:hypothetical protein lbkm_2632 [Lachnospiraceae bacterium KM106-2]